MRALYFLFSDTAHVSLFLFKYTFHDFVRNINRERLVPKRETSRPTIEKGESSRTPRVLSFVHFAKIPPADIHIRSGLRSVGKIADEDRVAADRFEREGEKKRRTQIKDKCARVV